MIWSILKRVVMGEGVFLAAVATLFAAGMIVNLSGAAFASPRDSLLEPVQIAHAHAGRIEIVGESLWATNGEPAADEDISAEEAAHAPTRPEAMPRPDHMLAIGRVVEVDSGAGRITVEHRPIERLYMESMTTIFRVKDPAMLAGLTPGDKVRFDSERDKDGFVITKIEHSIR